MRRRWLRRHRPPCRDVAAVIQLYVDGRTDDATTDLVRAHLEDCRRCGMDRDVYLALKRSLVRGRTLDVDALVRLRAFGDRLTAAGVDGGRA
jgi:anti-sigma factor RsiW